MVAKPEAVGERIEIDYDLDDDYERKIKSAHVRTEEPKRIPIPDGIFTGDTDSLTENYEDPFSHVVADYDMLVWTVDDMPLYGITYFLVSDTSPDGIRHPHNVTDGDTMYCVPETADYVFEGTFRREVNGDMWFEIDDAHMYLFGPSEVLRDL